MEEDGNQWHDPLLLTDVSWQNQSSSSYSHSHYNSPPLPSYHMQRSIMADQDPYEGNVAKHLWPLLKVGRGTGTERDVAVVANLSARVGSIEDNRLGDWHSYRSSKAALN